MSTYDDAWLMQQLRKPGYRVVGGAAPTPAPITVLPAPPPPLDRYKSKTERRYAQVLEADQYAGMIVRWWYEPCKGLYLAPKTSYTPDFLVELKQSHTLNGWTRFCGLTACLVFVEVKGAFIRPQDWQKTKQAAALYPCFRFVLAQWKQGAWHYKEVPSV